MDSKIKYKEGKFKERGSNMEALTNVLENFLMPISSWVSRNKSLQGISKGFMRILPVTILSSMFYLIANFPITGWTNWLASSGIGNYILIHLQLPIVMRRMRNVMLCQRGLSL